MPNICLNTTTTCSGAVWPLPPISKCYKILNIDKQASKHPRVHATEDDDAPDAMGTRDRWGEKENREEKKWAKGGRDAR